LSLSDSLPPNFGLQFECAHLSPPSRIVDALDVVKDISSCFGMRFVVTTINALTFQHAEEALAGSIVRAAADTAHRARQVVTFQEALILGAAKLTTAIAVQDHRLP